jgi:hypothetical protein
MADEATSWNALYSGFDLSRTDHSQLYSTESGIYTNGAEESKSGITTTSPRFSTRA